MKFEIPHFPIHFCKKIEFLKEIVYWYIRSVRPLMIIIVSLQSFSFQINGQDKHKVDSLEQLLKTSEDHTKVEVLFELTKQFYQSDNKTALKYAEKAKNLVEQSNDSLQYIRAFRVYGLLLQLNGRIDEAIHLLKSIELIALRQKAIDEYKKVINYLALCYTFNADFPEALKYNFKSLTLRESLNDKDGICIALNNIGLIYMEANDYTRALEYFDKSLKVLNETNYRYEIGKLFVNIGMCYSALHEIEKARVFILRGLNSCHGPCSKVIQNEALGAYASGFEKEAKYDSAKKYYLKAYQLAKEVGDKRNELYNLLGLGRIYTCLGNQGTAMKYFFYVDSIDKRCQYPALAAEACARIGNHFFQIRDFERADRYHQKYKVLQDTLYQRSLRMIAVMGEIEAERRENVAKIESQNKIINLNKEVIAGQRKINVIVAIAGFLAIGFIGLLFHNIHQRKNVNRLLEIRVAERTHDLTINYESSRKALAEQEQIIARMSRDVKDAMSSLRGVSFLAQTENRQAFGDDYRSKVDHVINQLLHRLPKEHNI